MKIRENGWVVLNVYVVRELIKGKIPVYNLPLQSTESESVTKDCPFRIKDQTKDKILGVRNTIFGVVDLGNGQLKELVLHRPVGGEGLKQVLDYSMSELPEEVDRSYVMD